MNPRVKDVKPQDNYRLLVTFTNGEVGLLDMEPYLDYNMFKSLRNVDLFNGVRPAHGTIQWANEADLCPDTVYLDSVKV
ncbi:MAG: DUF2442 domain-containing protein [Prevotellaceae bacterium]|jgi:hypothetical protein|nr:DUF2442 domain-containing protein [Prevotellaceae bacterium]